jgi:hypothetical protein
VTPRSTFTDETLAALVDGELDAATRTLVETAARADPDLAARLKAQRDLKALLAGHYAPIAEEPLPENLLETIRRGAPASAEVVTLASRRAAATPGAKPPFRLPAWAGMAACLVVGLVVGLPIGRLALPTSVGLNGGADQRLVASGPLARALDGQLAAENSGPIRIGLSFRDHAGRYCRTFQPSAREGLAGLACRENDAWRLRVVSPMTAQAATYRTANAEIPPAVLSSVDDMIDGAPLDRRQEEMARSRDWRR